MKRRFDFGKIDWNGKGRKINAVTLEVELRDVQINGKTLPEFSVVGNVWNNRRTDIVAGGQMLDLLKPYFENNELFQQIYYFWENYHLNSLHAGTQKQEYLLEGLEPPCSYDDRKNTLIAANLIRDYEAPFDLCNGGVRTDDDGRKYYEYGWGWVYWPIPAGDLIKIEKLIEED